MTTLSQLESVRDLAYKIGNLEDYSVVCDFIRHLERRGGLSGGQQRYFESIAARNTPEIAVASKNFLKTLQDPAVKPEIYAVCKYYSGGRYWRQSEIAKKILGWYVAEDAKAKGAVVPDMPLPSYPQFLSIFENKYAKKIRQNVCAPRLWDVGDLVQIRKASAGEVREANGISKYSETLVGGLRSREGWTSQESHKSIPFLWDVPCAIIEITDKVGRPLDYNEKRGGTRYYRLLALGQAHPFLAMERDLKKVIKKRIS
jgi:hypothetical protein